MRDKSGFSLIEALVALALLAVGSLLLAQAGLLSLQAGARSRSEEKALALAAAWSEKIRLLPWETATEGCERPAAPVGTALCRVESGRETCRVRVEKKDGRTIRQRLSVVCGENGRGITLETAYEAPR